MPDAFPHCKRLAAELSGVLSEKLATSRRRAKASDAPNALVKIKVTQGHGGDDTQSPSLRDRAANRLSVDAEIRTPNLNAIRE
jgi:hypothetical protein